MAGAWPLTQRIMSWARPWAWGQVTDWGLFWVKLLHFSSFALILWLVWTTVSTIPWWPHSWEVFFLYEMRAHRCWFEERQIKPKHKIAKNVVALCPVRGEQWSLSPGAHCFSFIPRRYFQPQASESKGSVTTLSCHARVLLNGKSELVY